MSCDRCDCGCGKKQAAPEPRQKFKHRCACGKQWATYSPDIPPRGWRVLGRRVLCPRCAKREERCLTIAR